MPVQRHWRPAEDRCLLAIINRLGNTTNWEQVSASLAEQDIYKNPNQCKRRYNNHLIASINNKKFDFSEQIKLFKLFKQHGNSWKLISTFYDNRTDNIIKNTFFGMMRRCVRLMNKLTGGEMNKDTVNLSKPNVILEFLMAESEEGFTPVFKVFDVVEYFVSKLSVSIFHNFPEDIVKKAKHTVEIFKGIKDKDDMNPRVLKRVKKLKFFKNYNKFYFSEKDRGTLFDANDCFGRKRVREMNESCVFIHELKKKLATIKSLVNSEIGIFEEGEIKIFDFFIEFLYFVKTSFINTPFMKNVELFLAMKKVVVSGSDTLVKLSERRNKGLKVSVSILQPVIESLSSLLKVLTMNNSNGDLVDVWKKSEVFYQYKKESSPGTHNELMEGEEIKQGDVSLEEKHTIFQNFCFKYRKAD